MSPSDGPTAERVELAKETRRLREARGLSIRKLTELAQYSSPHKVGEIENPDKPVPSLTLIAAVDITLNAGGRLIELRSRAYDAHMRRREALKTMMGSAAVIALPDDALGSFEEIVERIALEQLDYVDPRLVDELERLAAAAVVDYVTTHSAVLVSGLRQWNDGVGKLLRGEQRPSELKRLQAVGCQFSGVLSKVSADLGKHDFARVYALQAYTRADRQGDPNLRAWSRGMQSMAAYKAGDFVDAVGLARQPGEDCGHQAARLAFDEAKALAEMGDRKGVVNAVERGMSSSSAAVRTVVSRSDVTVGSYDLAHAGRWACYAYVVVGDAHNAQKCAEYPLLACDQREDDPGGAFMRMELATTLVESDPSQAGELVIAAMDYTTKHPLATIMPRIKGFLTAAQSPKVRNVPAIRDAVEAARTVLR